MDGKFTYKDMFVAGGHTTDPPALPNLKLLCCGNCKQWVHNLLNKARCV